MAKKEYPWWHYAIAAGLALAIGVVYTFVVSGGILGPAMLVVGGVMGAFAWSKKRKSSA